VHDEFLFDLHQEELSKMRNQQPFFSALFTLSSHPPYDMPIKTVRHYGDERNEYLNSIHYTDSCLGAYMAKLKELPFYDNTIFIITGDHGYYAPGSGDKFSKQYNHIPMLIYGQPLKEIARGKQIEHLGSQVDLAPTLLSQLGIDSDKFRWGKDLLDPTSPEFAYYSGPNSVAWVRPYGYFAYENRYAKYMHLELQDSTRQEELIGEGRAYAQMVFQDYLDH